MLTNNFIPLTTSHCSQQMLGNVVQGHQEAHSSLQNVMP